MLTRLQIRRSTSIEWESINPVLLSGELGLETNTNLIKVGNGVDNWISLPYINDPEIIEQQYSTIVNLNDNIFVGSFELSRGIVYEIELDIGSYFCLYNSFTSLVADENRPITQDPVPSSGVILETNHENESKITLTPPAVAISNDPAKLLHYKIVSNNSNATLNLKYIKI